MHEPPQQQGKQVTVHYLPVHVVERLDAKFSELLASNGGYADWVLKVDHGIIRFIKSTETEFLEPTNEARKQPFIN